MRRTPMAGPTTIRDRTWLPAIVAGIQEVPRVLALAVPIVVGLTLLSYAVNIPTALALLAIISRVTHAQDSRTYVEDVFD